MDHLTHPWPNGKTKSLNEVSHSDLAIPRASDSCSAGALATPNKILLEWFWLIKRPFFSDTPFPRFHTRVLWTLLGKRWYQNFSSSATLLTWPYQEDVTPSAHRLFCLNHHQQRFAFFFIPWLRLFLFNFSVLPYPQTHMRVPWTPLEEKWDHEFLFWPLGVDMTRTARFQFEHNHVRFFHVITSFSFN